MSDINDFLSTHSPYFSSGGYNPEHLAMDTNAAGLSLHLSLLFIVGLGEVVPILHRFATHPQVLPDSEGETPSDPDPKIAAVAFHIFPLMFLASLSHQILLITSSMILGALVFPALALFIGLDYLILWCICKEEDMVDADPGAGTKILNHF